MIDRRGNTANVTEREVLNGPSGGLGHRRGDSSRSMPRKDNAGDARAVGAAQHGTKVARIRHTITDQEKWLRDAQKIIEGHGLQIHGDSHDALVALSLGLTVEASHRNETHGNALTLCLELDGVKNVRRVLRLSDKYFSYSASFREQKFKYSVASLNLISADSFSLTRRCATGTVRRTTTGSTSRWALGATRRGWARTHDSSLRSTTALAAIPSPRPSAPSPSKVVAFTETVAPVMLESSSDMAGM